MSTTEPSNEETGKSTPEAADPAANLLFADIVLRGAGRVMRETLEKRMVVSNYDPDKARDAVDGRTVLTSVALYGASKLAGRSNAGLALVAGGLVLKALYDRGKARQLAELEDHKN